MTKLHTIKLVSVLTCCYALAFAGCVRGGPRIDRTQPNLIDKSAFEGEWWVSETVVNADADSTGPTWTGQMGADFALDNGQSIVLGKIRWVIDEDYLFAYRSYELVDGGNGDGRDPNFRGQPLAAFEILDHVDVRPDYNAVTGENFNVIEENTEDRRWFERQYVRVDWSKNHVQSFFFAAQLSALGGWTIEPGDFFIQDENSHGAFPRSWSPQFVTVADDPNYRFRQEWPEGSEDTVHYMSFVTFKNLSPGDNCLYIGGGPCQALSIPSRLAFLRVPPNHQYAAAKQSHDEFDKFGVFRTYQRTYLRGGQAQETVARRCDRNQDCGTGGYCNPESHICAGGLTEDYGETDLLAFLRPRHNLFEQSLTDTTCAADWQCDGRFSDTPGQNGSVCDSAARRCTVPLHMRTPRKLIDPIASTDEQEARTGAVAYHLNAGYPKHLVHAAYEVMGNWNEVFMRGWRASQGRALPDYGAVRIGCQTDDPTRYCYCGSPDDVGGSCKGKYDPFVTPGQWVEFDTEGKIGEPYQCHIQNAEFFEPTAPTSYDDYPLPQAYRYTFVGDECLLVLRTNTCDWHRTDDSQSCDDLEDASGEPLVWEDLGDLRYQFFNYIDQVNTPFGGVSALRSDPTTGELVTANANFSAAGVEKAATRAIDFFPVLRCENETLGCEPGDEGAAERYLSGENLRGYFSRLGNTEHAIGLAASGSDGFSVDDRSRPSLPVDVNGALREVMSKAENRIERLRGHDGRAQILSDRMRKLAGTQFEYKLMESLGVNGFEAMNQHFDHGQDYVFDLNGQASITDDAVLDRISPFRGNGFIRTLTQGERDQAELAAHNICTFNQAEFRSRYWEYWAEAFRGRAPAEASIRMQQLYTRMVQHHEMGHSVGLRHNFGASFDRNNYGDGFFNVVVGNPDQSGDDLALPKLNDFDLDNSGFVAGEEFDAYLGELRRVRNTRARRGVHNYMTGSTMDYNGDTSDAQGLGHYDVAATVWNYFDLQEAYVGNPTTAADGPFQGLTLRHTADRVWWRSYLGGESCQVDRDERDQPVDDDCPYAEGSAALADGQPVYQRCVVNPRQAGSSLQFPCPIGAEDCVCSNFDADMQDFLDDAAYETDQNDDGKVDFSPVDYLFCTDDRTNDISWCSRFDAGESFQEVIDHYRRGWQERYPADYYRRFQRGGARKGGSIGSILDAAKIYQHLFFRVFFEPGFQFNEGPLGFDDQFLASVDAMNWFIEILNLPDEGSYDYDAASDVYRWMGETVDLPGSDISLLPGQGFGMWTKYQEGYFGFFRPERAGVFYDKFFALQALAIRDWGLNFTLDERYYINFYDLFATEMSELFGGVILQDPTWFAPRLQIVDGEPVVQNMSWYRGLALGECTEGGASVPCRGSQPEVYPGPAIEGTTNEVLRSWATMLALAQFPVYYDTSFEQRLLIFKAGSGAGFRIPDFQSDGSPTCVYGRDVLDQGHVEVNPGAANGCDTSEDADYVAYESERFRTPYLAVKIRPSLDFNLEEEQVGFQLLRRLSDLQTEVAALPSGAVRDRKLRELQQGESYLEYLIDLQAAFGISIF